jgi:hypothetical protein
MLELYVDNSQNGMACVLLTPKVGWKTLALHLGLSPRHSHWGARRRRNGDDPGGGYARKPVGTYLYLHAVGAGNPVAVTCLAR